IPESYFNNNPYTKYEIKVHPSYDNGEFGNQYENTFALDYSQVLAAKNSKGADLGTIAVNKRQSSNIESFLAGLSLQNIMATLRIPTAYAQYKIGTPEGEEGGTLNLDTTTPWKFEIDLDALGETRKVFSLKNYNLRHVEINPPSQGLDINQIDRDYQYFARGADTEDSKEGAWLV